MQMSTSSISTLPSSPSKDLTDKYLFIDSRQVVEDMRDLGFEVAGFRRPVFRTERGAYGLHEIDFRRPQDLALSKNEAPRILFMNSYDGSRKAQLISGVIRFACSNGLVVGDMIEKQKFLHLGDYAEELLKQIRESAAITQKVFDRIADYREIKLDEGVYLQMAGEAARLRYPDNTIELNPRIVISPRRREDVANDLWTVWNRVQENLVKGGITGVDANAKVRVLSPVKQIQKSNELNMKLWNLMETYAQAA